MRKIRSEIRRLQTLDDSEIATAAKELQSPLDLVRGVAEAGKLPVVLFCAGGIATPADASLMMQLGAEGVFVGSGIFKSDNPRCAPRRSSRRPPTIRMPIASPAPARVWARRWCRWRRASSGAAAPRQPRLVTPPPAALIGVLALQGDFEAHAKVLRGLGAEVRRSARLADLDGLDGLVIPAAKGRPP